MIGHTCEICGKALESTGDGSEWMNSYQWNAVKAGDYFAECENPNHPNGNCYFWERDGGKLYRPDTRSTPSDSEEV